MDFEKVLTDLKNGKGDPSPCYLLYGEEEYLIKDALNRLISIIIPAGDRDLNLFFMEGENEDIDDVCETILTPPLIPGKKVVVLKDTRLFQSRSTLSEITQKIRNTHENDPDMAARYFMQFLKITGWNLDDLRDGGWKKITDDDWQKIAEGDSGYSRETWLPGIIEFCVSRNMEVRQRKDDTDRIEDVLKSGIPQGNHLIMTAEAVDKRKRLFKVISESGIILHFSQARGEARQKNVLMETAKDILAKSGKKMTPGAWLAIGRKTGFTLADSMGALELLITYTGERMVIEESDVAEVIGKTKEDTVFDLTRALIDKDLNTALANLKDLFHQGVHHLLIVSMIAREIRFLLHAKIFIRSGKINSFQPNMDYDAFQRSVYPAIQMLTNDKERKKGKRSDLSSQHAYVIYNALKNSQRFSYEDLVKFLEDLAEMDIVFKTTAKSPIFMMERFIMKVCA